MDPAAQQFVLEGSGYFCVLVGQDMLAADDQAHLRPERAEHVHELDPRHPRTDHYEVLRELGRRVGLPRRQYPVTVRDCPVRNTGPAARRDNHSISVQLLLLAGSPSHGDRMRAEKARLAPHRPDAERSEQSLDRRLQPRADLADPVAEGLVVHLARRAVEREPKASHAA